jgi:hypothetical protein
MEFEYLVLGMGSVEVTDSSRKSNLSLHDALKNSNVHEIQGILNALGNDGWQVVTLSWPYVFMKQVTGS